MRNTLWLQTRPAKTIIIGLLSLGAAALCFGVLSSSGVVNNGYVEIGGAFAGFAVAVILLNRVWGKEDNAEAVALQTGAEFLFEEVVKVLDLRNAPPQADPQRAKLTDYYRVRRIGKSSVVETQYGATRNVEFTGSTTHPSAKLRLKEPDHLGPHGEKLKKQFALTVQVGELGRGETFPLLYNFVYTNSFRNLETEWLETHTDYPTSHLTMVILAPDNMRFTGATGGTTVGRRELERTPEQPTVIQDASVIYWAIENPVLSTRYALSWEWEPRTAQELLDHGSTSDRSPGQ